MLSDPLRIIDHMFDGTERPADEASSEASASPAEGPDLGPPAPRAEREEAARNAAADAAERDAARRRLAAWAVPVGPIVPDDAEERRAQLHADLDALLDTTATDPGACLASALVSWDRLRRSIDGSLVATVSGFSRSGEWATDAHRSPTSWLIATTGLRRPAAGSLRSTCERVADHPALAAAAASGRLSMDHLRLLIDARVAPLVDTFDADVEGLIAAACRMTVDALAHRLGAWRFEALAHLEENEPDGPEPDDPAATTCRITDLLWGRARAEVDLAPADAAELKAALEREHDALAALGAFDDDPRSLREIHGELLMAIVRRGSPRTDACAPAPLINATVDLDTLLRRAGEHDPAERTRRVADLAGHGPVNDATIAELVARAQVALLVTHPVTGQPLWYGRARRLATPAQRQAVIAASDGCCSFPGCTVPAERCQVDHRTGWRAGGPTDIDNLELLCAFHNRLKHRWRLRAVRGLDGALAWTHPDGTPIRSRYEAVTGRRERPPGWTIPPDPPPQSDAPPPSPDLA